MTDGFPNSDNKFFSSLYNNNKGSKIQSFPEILKPRNFEFTGEKVVQPKGWREGKMGEKKFMAKSLVGKSVDKDDAKVKN